MKKKYLIHQITCVLFVTTITTLTAQKTAETKPSTPAPTKPANPMANLTVGKIYGKIVEKQTEQPIP